MKVLFITRKYPPAVGGMELFAYELSQALAVKTEVRLVKWSGYGRLRAVLWALPSLFVRSFWDLLTHKTDVIHAHDSLLAPIALVLSRLFRKPFVVVVHGLDATYANPLFRAVVPAAVRRANAVVCISRATAETVQKAGVPADKIHQLPLAVNDIIFGQSNRQELLRKLDLPANSQILLSVGRLVPRKGVAWFVEHVMPQLRQQYPGLIYLVIGAGPDKSNVEAAVNKHNLNKSVRLLGSAEAGLLASSYNGADIYVMPNIKVADDMEGFGLVLLEAALCELPIVASRLEGIEDAIQDGKNGLLVPPGNSAAFIEQISSLLNNAKAARQFGKNSRRYTLAAYQWGKIADRYLEVYGQVG